MKETAFQTIVSKYIQEKQLYCNYECKVAEKDDKVYFKDFQPQQISSLQSAQVSGYHHKYSDMDPRLKGFDGSNNPPLPGYIILKFKKSFHVIPVDNFVFFKERTKKTYITQGEAYKISVYDVI